MANIAGRVSLIKGGAGLEGMRDVLRGSLGRSLRGLAEENRIAAAWTVVCGPALGGRGRVTGYEDSVVRVAVEDPVWRSEMTAMRGTLAREIAATSGLRVDGIEFTVTRRGDDE